MGKIPWAVNKVLGTKNKLRRQMWCKFTEILVSSGRKNLDSKNPWRARVNGSLSAKPWIKSRHTRTSNDLKSEARIIQCALARHENVKSCQKMWEKVPWQSRNTYCAPCSRFNTGGAWYQLLQIHRTACFLLLIAYPLWWSGKLRQVNVMILCV